MVVPLVILAIIAIALWVGPLVGAKLAERRQRRTAQGKPRR